MLKTGLFSPFLWSRANRNSTLYPMLVWLFRQNLFCSVIKDQ